VKDAVCPVSDVYSHHRAMKTCIWQIIAFGSPKN